MIVKKNWKDRDMSIGKDKGNVFCVMLQHPIEGQRAEGTLTTWMERDKDGVLKNREETRGSPWRRPSVKIPKRIQVLRTLVFVHHMLQMPKQTHVAVPHSHPDAEEVFYFIKGTGTFMVGKEKTRVTSGDIVYIPPNTMHLLTNDGDEILEFIDFQAPVGDALKKLLKVQEERE